MDLYNVTLLTDLSLDFLIDTLEQAGRSLVIFYKEPEAPDIWSNQLMPSHIKPIGYVVLSAIWSIFFGQNRGPYIRHGV